MNTLLEGMKKHIRFETNRGTISMEDLFDLPLVSQNGFSLNDILLDLEKKKPSVSSYVEELLANDIKKDNLVQLKIDIVKMVIDYKVKELRKAKEDAIRKMKKEKIMEILRKKEESELLEKDTKELKKMLEDL